MAVSKAGTRRYRFIVLFLCGKHKNVPAVQRFRDLIEQFGILVGVFTARNNDGLIDRFCYSLRICNTIGNRLVGSVRIRFVKADANKVHVLERSRALGFLRKRRCTGIERFEALAGLFRRVRHIDANPRRVLQRSVEGV